MAEVGWWGNHSSGTYHVQEENNRLFVVSQDLAGAVVGACVIDDALFDPHCPVRLYIKAKPRNMMVRTLKTARTIEATLPHGPLGKPVEHKDNTDNLSKDELYQLFLQRMEEDTASLLAVDGKAKEAIMGRNDGPKFVMKSALGENNGGTRRTTAVSRAWRRSTSGSAFAEEIEEKRESGGDRTAATRTCTVGVPAATRAAEGMSAKECGRGAPRHAC